MYIVYIPNVNPTLVYVYIPNLNPGLLYVYIPNVNNLSYNIKMTKLKLIFSFLQHVVAFLYVLPSGEYYKWPSYLLYY